MQAQGIAQRLCSVVDLETKQVFWDVPLCIHQNPTVLEKCCSIQKTLSLADWHLLGQQWNPRKKKMERTLVWPLQQDQLNHAAPGGWWSARWKDISINTGTTCSPNSLSLHFSSLVARKVPLVSSLSLSCCGLSSWLLILPTRKKSYRFLFP